MQIKIRKYLFIYFTATNKNLNLGLNLVFYVSIIFNGIGMHISESVPYIGTSWLLSFFSSFSAFLLIYIVPFFYPFDYNHVLGRLYLLLLSTFTMTTGIILCHAPSWAFLTLLLLIIVVFNVTYALSDYVQSLTHLRSLPLKLRYQKLFLDVANLVALMFFTGLVVFFFFNFTEVLQFVCIYTYCVSAFFVFPTVLTDLKKKQKKKRRFPTSITKLILFYNKNNDAFYDVRVIYLAGLTFLRSYTFFTFAFLAASFGLGGMHIFVYYSLIIYAVTLLVSFPSIQNNLKNRYGSKSLRLLGWNSPVKAAIFNERAVVVYTTLFGVSAFGFTRVSSSENERQCMVNARLRSQIDSEYTERIQNAGNDKHLVKIAEKTHAIDMANARNPTLSETRQAIIKDVIDPIGTFIRDIKKK